MAKKSSPLSLNADDVSGRYWVEAKLNPQTPKDKMLLAQIAQMMRQPGAGGKPMMADRDVLRYILDEAHPEEIATNVELQMLEAANPEVQKLKSAAAFKEWKDNNKQIVKTAEKELEPPSEDEAFEKMKKTLTPEKFKQIVQLAAQAEVAKMQGHDPKQVMNAMMMGGAAAQQASDQQSMLPASVAPPGVAPQGAPSAGVPADVMPSQMMMQDASAQTDVNPDARFAEQAARGQAQR